MTPIKPNRGFRRLKTRAIRLIRMVWFTTRFTVTNRVRKQSDLGDIDVVVSLTSYGQRTNSVFLTIESILAGRQGPKRIILWLDETEVLEDLPASLRRLQHRGLEILPCFNYGPHKKYFPYVLSTDDSSNIPLVTADDDIFYPQNWLASLHSEYVTTADSIVSHRARQIGIIHDSAPTIDKYSQWKLADSTSPSFSTFSTGTGGVIYPPAVLRQLRRRGEEFITDYWHADDIWLHSTAVAAGVRTRQVSNTPKNFLMLLGSQTNALFKRNHEGDGNDVMIQTAYTVDLIDAIANDIKEINKV